MRKICWCWWWRIIFGLLDAVCYFCLLLFVSPWGSNVLNFFFVSNPIIDYFVVCAISVICDINITRFYTFLWWGFIETGEKNSIILCVIYHYAWDLYISVMICCRISPWYISYLYERKRNVSLKSEEIFKCFSSLIYYSYFDMRRMIVKSIFFLFLLMWKK